MATLKQHAQTALDVQNAVNLSGVLHAWQAAQVDLMAACGGNTSGEYRRHPVNVLFLSKVLSLMVVAGDCLGGVYKNATVEGFGLDGDLFVPAYEACTQLAKGEG